MSSIDLTGFDLEIQQMAKILSAPPATIRLTIDADHVTRRIQHTHAHTPATLPAHIPTISVAMATDAGLRVATDAHSHRLRPSVALLAAVVQLNALLRAQSGASDAILPKMLAAIHRATSDSENKDGVALGAVDLQLAGVSLTSTAQEDQFSWSDSAQLAQLWRPLLVEIEDSRRPVAPQDVYALLSAHSISFAASADLLFASDAAVRGALLACALSADSLGLSVSLWSSASAAASPPLRKAVRDLQLLLEDSVATRSAQRPPDVFIGSPATIATTFRAMELVSDELRRAVNSHDSELLLLVPPMPAETKAASSSSSSKRDTTPTLTSKLAGKANKHVPQTDDESSVASESRGAPVEQGHFVLSGTGAHVGALALAVKGLVSALVACGQSSASRTAALLERYPRASCARRCLPSLASTLVARMRRSESAPFAELVQLTPVIPQLLKVLAIECAVAGSVLRYRQSPNCEAELARPLSAIPPKLRVAAAAFERLGADSGDDLDLAPAFDLFLNPGKLRSINPLIPKPSK
jgi:hypothetical protein